MNSDLVFFVIIFFSLAVIGGGKLWTIFDSDEKVKKSAQGWLARWFS